MAIQTQETADGFAAQAMSAIVASPDVLAAVTGSGAEALKTQEGVQAVAVKAYDIAAAMMAERGRRLRLEPEFKLKTKDLKL